jgi:ABC-2 type transport system ATP-binding protein
LPGRPDGERAGLVLVSALKNPAKVPPVSSPAIDVRGVCKRFGARQSLQSLDLTVERGAVLGLLGPNGAGKTTTLRILLGLLRFDSGSVRVLDLDPRTDSQRIRESVGVLLENDGLYERLPALANLDYHARIRHLGAAQRATRIEELLRSFDLWERRADAVISWSKGMRQKLAVARALLHRPKLLLLDEPFTGLDPAAAVDLRARIAAMARDESVTVLMTTHDLAHVEKACSHVAVLRNGSIIATGAPDAIGRSDSEVQVDVSGEGLSEAVLAAMKREGLVRAYTLDGSAARVTCDVAARAGLGLALFERGVAVVELHTVKSSLEEAFLSIVARSDSDKDSAS